MSNYRAPDIQLLSEKGKLLGAILESAHKHGFGVFAVGGLVRDLLLGQPGYDQDLDLVVEGDAYRLAVAMQSQVGGTIKRFEKFLTAKLILPVSAGQTGGWGEIDFATARVERYIQPGQLPEVKSASISEDLRRRDFTVNALALPLSALVQLQDKLDQQVEFGVLRSGVVSEILDQFGGLADLDRRIVRILHAESFRDDPTRIFRAARYAARFANLAPCSDKTSLAQRCRERISTDTLAALDSAIKLGALSTISNFRCFAEVKQIASEPTAAVALHFLEEAGVMDGVSFFPIVRERQLLWRELEALSVLGINRLGLIENGHPFEGSPINLVVSLALFVGCAKRSGAAESLAGVGMSKRQLMRLEEIDAQAVDIRSTNDSLAIIVGVARYYSQSGDLDECRAILKSKGF